jgi:very-short-patch-repair endonuclease
VIYPQTRYTLEVAKVQASKRLAAEGYHPATIERRLKIGDEYVFQGWKACESPIEALMVPALVFGDWHGFQDTTPAKLFPPYREDCAPRCDLLIVPQMNFMRYRADFGIICRLERGASKTFFVECDGVEFHADWVKDRARDQYCEAFGIETVRLSGIDITADPFAAAQRLVSKVTAWKDAVSRKVPA